MIMGPREFLFIFIKSRMSVGNGTVQPCLGNILSTLAQPCLSNVASSRHLYVSRSHLNLERLFYMLVALVS